MEIQLGQCSPTGIINLDFVVYQPLQLGVKLCVRVGIGGCADRNLQFLERQLIIFSCLSEGSIIQKSKSPACMTQ